MSDKPSLSPESQKALEIQAIQQKVKEIENVSRLCVNTLNLLCSNDITIPSAYAKPVAEIQDWLTGMHQNFQQNLNVLKPLLPAEAPKSDQAAPTVENTAKDAVVDQGSGKAVKLEVLESGKKASKKAPKE